MIMELLGPNLSDLMRMCGGRFTLGTTVVLAMQIVIHKIFSFKDSNMFIPKDMSIEISSQRILLWVLEKNLLFYTCWILVFRKDTEIPELIYISLIEKNKISVVHYVMQVFVRI